MALLCALPPILMSAIILAQSARVTAGELRRNPYFGIRTPSTLRNDQAWLAAHRAALRHTPWYLLVTLATWSALAAAVVYSSRTVVVLVGIAGFVATMTLSICTAVIAQ